MFKDGSRIIWDHFYFDFYIFNSMSKSLKKNFYFEKRLQKM